MQQNAYDYDDLKQVGVDGFLRAIEKFNSNGGASFSTYAIPWIKQRIQRFMISNQTSIRTPAHIGFAQEKFVDNIDDVAFMLKDEDKREEQLEFMALDNLLDIAEESLMPRDFVLLLLRYRLEEYRLQRLLREGRHKDAAALKVIMEEHIVNKNVVERGHRKE